LLFEIVEEAPAVELRLEAPLIGRREELAALRQMFDQGCENRRCKLVTVLGEAGLGRNRVTLEWLVSMEEAVVLTGNCVSYGDGVTYLPLDQMLQQSGESFTTLTAKASSTGEIAFLVRKRFEHLAARKPHVLVFEDVHWAEPTLLDLIDDLGERVEAPVLCVCSARPELQKAHGAGAGAVVELAALPDEHTRALVDSLAADLAQETRTRIVENSEGNPLFAEQLVVHVRARGADSLHTVPPSIEALLASRLDLLSPNEREALQRTAVIGPEFTTAGVEALGPAQALPGLQRRGLVHGDGDRFRIHHILVRDVAYMSIPKTKRAQLHERYADWLEG